MHGKDTITCVNGKYSLKGKGKEIPLQAWTGRGGSRRFEAPRFGI
jgi:hypothetical protein